MTFILRSALALGFSAALIACGSRSQLREMPPPLYPADVTADIATTDVTVTTDVPVRPDVPIVQPDVPVIVDVVPDVVTPRVDVACPAPIRSTQSLTEMIAATAMSNVGRPLTVRWTLESRPMASMATVLNETMTNASIRFDQGGEYRFRFTATDDLGNMATCTTRADVESAIALLCPNDQSNFQGATVSLRATATSRLGRRVTVAWNTDARPAGSVTNPTPPTSLDANLLLDQLGDWRLRLVATDETGLTESCVAQVHADPDVLVTCPPDTTSRPFATIALTGNASSRTMRPLTYRWEIVDRPVTSTASLTTMSARTTGFTFDVAGNWTYRFTATNDRGNSAFCTTRALSASEEAVRVEIVWNTDRSNPRCNVAMPAGNQCGDIDLHVTYVPLAMGRWADTTSDCYFSNCRCGMPGMLCTTPSVEWPPAGIVNNPQLDVDHTDDLPGPENINIVRAEAGHDFDVGVHVYRLEDGVRTPVVARVYCSGRVVFESEPVSLSTMGASPDGNPLWLVGRVSTTLGGCTFARCGRPGALTECIRPEGEWGTMGGGMGGMKAGR